MLRKCIGKYKRRTMFYAYQTIAQDSQAQKVKTVFVNKQVFKPIESVRPYSVISMFKKSKASPTQEAITNEVTIEYSPEYKLQDLRMDGQKYQENFIKYAQEGYQYKSLIECERQAKQGGLENGQYNQNQAIGQDDAIDKDGKCKFNNMLQTKENEIIYESLKMIDKKNFLMNLLSQTRLSQLSSEILKISFFARGLYRKQTNEQVIQFLICLDLQIKGLLTHWQIRLGESNKSKGKSTELMKGLDVKFPILIGDQYHTIAYYIVSRLGNIELTRILTIIEENFQKICFNIEGLTNSFENNIQFIYNHFYNYLPTFFGQGFKGVALIYNLGQSNIQSAFDIGIELGYFFQFGIFSYIMCGVINQSNKEVIKEHLGKVSSILQYLSFETIESMLYQMKSLNLSKFKTEFIMLTVFHAEQFNQKVDNLEIDSEIRSGLQTLVNEFLKDLLVVAEVDLNDQSNKQLFQDLMKKAAIHSRQENNNNIKNTNIELKPAFI